MLITTKNMKMEYDERRAAFLSIQENNKEEQSDNMDFLLTPAEFPQYDIEQARWLGNVFLTIEHQGKLETMETGSSADIRKIVIEKDKIQVSYEGDSKAEQGIKGINLSLTYKIKEEGIYWDIHLENKSKEDICIKKLGIPLLMNQYFRGDNYFKYDKCVLRHTSITHHHSYIYWSKSSGSMPILLFQALEDTPLVHFTCEKEDEVFGRKGSMHEAFEGCFYVYPVHESTEYSHIPASELILESDDKRTFQFFIGITDSFQGMEEQLINNGGFSVKALPGMCAPVGDEIHLLIRGGSIPKVRLKEKEDILHSLREKDGVYIANLRLGGYGRRNIIIEKENTTMHLQMFGIEQPGDIIKNQAQFIAKNQFETDEQDPCYHGLLMWDMMTKQRVNHSHNPFGPDWFAGGSDEIGLVSGLFLSGKNVYLPKEEEIRVLNAYIKDFIEKRLTEQPGYKVHRMVPWFKMFEPWAGYGADDAWRAFNYVHVINTYYNMYLISKKYEYTYLEQPIYYAKQAYEYMKGMFSFWMFPDGVGATKFANMGELHMALALGNILKEEGLLEESDWVEDIIKKKAQYFASQQYPYGSEMPYDSTAFEGVYAYGKAIGDKRVMEMTKDVTCANRGRQPIWYLYQTDLRQMGDSSWNVSYMTQLGAYPMYDWLFIEKSGFLKKETGEDTSISDLAEAWYASYLAGWSIYNSGGYWSDEEENKGASGWIIDGDVGNFTGVKKKHSPYLKGLVAMSGESALGFYGALEIAASAVVEHPVVGRYGFGCRIEDKGGEEIIIPTDGLGVRMYHLPGQWSLTLEQDSMSKVIWNGKRLKIYIASHTETPHTLKIQLCYRTTSYEIASYKEKIYNKEFEINGKEEVIEIVFK